MSKTAEVTVKTVAGLMISGAKKVVAEAEALLNKTKKEKGPDQKVAFPETAFYLPLANALLGAEVKSVRQGGLSLADTFATCDNGEMFVHHMHISPYQQKGFSIAEPYRKRKLLLHKNQILRLGSEVERKHLTIIPLKVYFDKQWVKMELGLCRGMKKYDKREKIAAEETKRRLAQIMRIRGKR